MAEQGEERAAAAGARQVQVRGEIVAEMRRKELSILCSRRFTATVSVSSKIPKIPKK